MVLWKAGVKRHCALEKIAEAVSLGASKEDITGLIDMAWELGLISLKEKEQLAVEQEI